MQVGKRLTVLGVSGLFLITVGWLVAVVTGATVIYIISLGLSCIVFVAFVLFALGAYGKVVARIGLANERLSHLIMLQERRYEQLSVRMDTLTEGLGGLSSELSKSVLQASKSNRGANELALLEEVYARLERTERRVLGGLENATHANERRELRLEKLLSTHESQDEPNQAN